MKITVGDNVIGTFEKWEFVDRKIDVDIPTLEPINYIPNPNQTFEITVTRKCTNWDFSAFLNEE